jgi:hypothetical protein
VDEIKSAASNFAYRIGKEAVERPEVVFKSLLTTVALLHLASDFAGQLNSTRPLVTHRVESLFSPELFWIALCPIDALIPWPAGSDYTGPKLLKRIAGFLALGLATPVAVNLTTEKLLATPLFSQRYHVTSHFDSWIAELGFTTCGLVGVCSLWFIKERKREQQNLRRQEDADLINNLDITFDQMFLNSLNELQAAITNYRPDRRPSFGSTDVVLDEERLKQEPPQLNLSSVQFEINEWEDLFQGVDDGNARHQQVLSALRTLSPQQNDELAEFHHEDSTRLTMLFAQLGSQLLHMTSERRPRYLDWLRDILHHCQTTWVQEIEAMLRDIVSPGQELEWQVRQRHQDLKWYLVITHIQNYLEVDGQHWKRVWSRVFGADLGMKDASGIDGEKIYLLRTRHWLLYIKMALWEEVLLMEKEALITLFRDLYTPEFLVDHWKFVTQDTESEKNRPLTRLIGDYMHEKYPRTYGLYYKGGDTTGGLNDKGAILFLQLMGEFQTSGAPLLHDIVRRYPIEL